MAVFIHFEEPDIHLFRWAIFHFYIPGDLFVPSLISIHAYECIHLERRQPFKGRLEDTNLTGETGEWK